MQVICTSLPIQPNKKFKLKICAEQYERLYNMYNISKPVSTHVKKKSVNWTKTWLLGTLLTRFCDLIIAILFKSFKCVLHSKSNMTKRSQCTQRSHCYLQQRNAMNSVSYELTRHNIKTITLKTVSYFGRMIVFNNF